MDNIYVNIEEYNPNKKCQILIVFDIIFADMLSNKNFNPAVTELFIRGRRLNIFLVFITQPYFSVPKNIAPNSTLYFIKKIPSKEELQKITFDHSSYVYFRDFMNLSKTIIFLVIDTNLASDNPLYFRKNLLERI